MKNCSAAPVAKWADVLIIITRLKVDMIVIVTIFYDDVVLINKATLSFGRLKL